MVLELNLYEIVHAIVLYRPKHPTKVHVWAGISKRGRTGICIFEGIMKKEMFVTVFGGASITRTFATSSSAPFITATGYVFTIQPRSESMHPPTILPGSAIKSAR